MEDWLMRQAAEALSRTDFSAGKVLAVGAEAILIKGLWRGYEAVAKYRPSKPYRLRELDDRIRQGRTSLEARLLHACRRLGVPAPTLLFVDPGSAVLLMDYIPGIRLSDGLPRIDDLRGIFERLGRYTGVLHENGVIHGDLTLANVLLWGNKEYLIDFGLGAFTRNLEDQGVDVHLMLRSLESLYPSLAESLYRDFMDGYAGARGNDAARRVEGKVREIRMRGRYVSERRLGTRLA